MEKDALPRVRIALVHPQNGRNVGAICRAMKNMGFADLFIVGGENLDVERAAVVAVHAADVLESSERVASLQEAVADAALVAGVTRRTGRRRKAFSLSSEELAEKICRKNSGLTAIVFGNEESGLSDIDLSLCNHAVRIPSSSLFPSLNLSHAVQIVLYDIFRTGMASSLRRFAPVTRNDLDRHVDVMLQSLQNIGFFKQVTSEDMRIFLRDVFARAGLSVREVRRLEGIFRKISGLCTGKGIST